MIASGVFNPGARRAFTPIALCALSAGLLACPVDTGAVEPETEPESEPEGEPESEPTVAPDGGVTDEDVVDAARALYPRYIDVQQYVVGKSCAPNLGVCHNTSNYPDLHSLENTFSLIAARCNVELPDPLAGWDNCEVEGDILYAGPSFASEIAYLDKTSDTSWTIGLKEAPTTNEVFRAQIYSPDNEVVLEPSMDWGVQVQLVEGETEVELNVGSPDGFIVALVEGAMGTVNAGDPNRNGVYGASDDTILSGALIVPGNLERSYLWGRMSATVPGSQMPLANDPLTPEMYVAVACWIESMSDAPAADDMVDYDNCAFAENPVDYTLYPGGVGAD